MVEKWGKVRGKWGENRCDLVKRYEMGEKEVKVGEGGGKGGDCGEKVRGSGVKWEKCGESVQKEWGKCECWESEDRVWGKVGKCGESVGKVRGK